MRPARHTMPVVILAAVALAAASCGGTSEIEPVAQVTVPSAPVVTTAAPVVTTPPTPAPPVTVTVTTRAAPPAPPAPALRPGVPVVTGTRYVQDRNLALRALTLFANSLRSIDTAAEFRSNLRLLRVELRIFDAAIRRLRGYQVPNHRLDVQRGRLGRLGPPLARSMSDFLDAVRDGDVAEARRLATEIQRRLNAFRRAS